jgi:hypothetical protein
MEELKNFIKNIALGNLQSAKTDLEDSILKKIEIRDQKIDKETPEFKADEK